MGAFEVSDKTMKNFPTFINGKILYTISEIKLNAIYHCGLCLAYSYTSVVAYISIVYLYISTILHVEGKSLI